MRRLLIIFCLWCLLLGNNHAYAQPVESIRYYDADASNECYDPYEIKWGDDDITCIDGVVVVDDIGSATVEGTAVLSTGEGGATKFLREDGDGTSSWQTATASHAGTITWSGTSILETGTAHQLGDGTDATVTYTWANTGTNVPIAFSSALMALTGAFTASSTIQGTTVTGTTSLISTGGLIEDTDNEDLVLRTNSNANQLVLDAAGNVGIGIASPQELLHVGVGIDASDISATDLLVTRAGPSSLSARDSTNDVETFLFASSVGGIMGTITNDPLDIKTNNTSAIFIDASQNVGIRTATPISPFEVEAGLTTTGAILTLGTKEPSVEDNDILGRINFYSPLETGADALLAGGSIWAEASGTFDATNNATDLVFGTATTSAAIERMRINSAGLVTVESLTASEILATDASKNLASLAVATYPSLAELAYVKGVTSAIQTQLDANTNKFYWVWRPQQGKLPTSDPMGIDAGNSRWIGTFDDTATDESVTHETVLYPYQGGTLAAKIYYILETTSTSDVAAFDLLIDCDSDGDASYFTETYGTTNSIDSPSQSLTAETVDVLTDLSLNEDSCAEFDAIAGKLFRDVSADGVIDDIRVLKVIIYEI